jgi:ribosome recycling factor
VSALEPTNEELLELVASLREEVARLKEEIRQIRRDAHEVPPHYQ